MANKLNVQFTARQSELLDNMAEELGTTKAGVVKRRPVLAGTGDPRTEGRECPGG